MRERMHEAAACISVTTGYQSCDLCFVSYLNMFNNLKPLLQFFPSLIEKQILVCVRFTFVYNL